MHHSREYSHFPVPTSPTYEDHQVVNTHAAKTEQISTTDTHLSVNEDFMEEPDCSLFTFVTYVGVFGSICVFGLIGNSVSWAVLSWERRQRGRVATFLLQTMAIVDNLFLLTAGVSQISVALKVYMYYSRVGEQTLNVTDNPTHASSDSSIRIHQLSNSTPKPIDTTQTPLVLLCREDEMGGSIHHVSSLSSLDLVGYRVNQTSCLGGHAVTESWGQTTVLNHYPHHFDYFSYLLSHVTAYVVVGVFPFVHITQMWTVWITVLVAVNRYVAICRPFQASQVCTMKQTKIQIISIGTAIFIYCLPRFFEYQIIYESDQNFGDIKVPVEVETDIKRNVIYNIVYENLLYCMFVFLGPLLIISILNACLVRELIRARRRRRARQLPLISCTSSGSRNCCSTTGGGGSGGKSSSGGDGGGESNLTLVMIVIVLMFVVCQTPAFANQVLYYWLEDDYACGKASTILALWCMVNVYIIIIAVVLSHTLSNSYSAWTIRTRGMFFYY